MKQTAALFVIPYLWSFRVVYEGNKVTQTELSAMIAIIVGTFWFLASDRAQSVIVRQKQEYRTMTQYTEASDDESGENLLMSWKEAEEVAANDLRLSKTDLKTTEQGQDFIIESQR